MEVAQELQPYQTEIINILDSVYSPQAYAPEDARNNYIELRLQEKKLQMKEFKALWNRINAKSAYTVSFDTDELVNKCIDALDKNLRVSQIFFKVEHGEMISIESKQALESGEAFKKLTGGTSTIESAVNAGIKYELIGKLVAETGLT